MQNCRDIKHFPISYNTATMYKISDNCAHIKMQQAPPLYSTCARRMAFRHDTGLVSGVQTANAKASWLFF